MRTTVKIKSYQALNLVSQIRLLGAAPNTPIKQEGVFKNERDFVFHHRHSTRQSDRRCRDVPFTDKQALQERGSGKCENEMCRYCSA